MTQNRSTLKKTILVLIILLCISGPLSALEYLPDSGFMGIGPGINGDARRGPSYGGLLLLGVNLNNRFSMGIKTSFFDNLDTVSAHETLLFFRYYFLPKNTEGPFAQLEGGGVLFFERGYHKYLEAFPALSGGLSVGWRFNLGEHWYLEPAARTGYPHIWGFSITTGIRFKSKMITIDDPKNKTDEQGLTKVEQNDNNIAQNDNIGNDNIANDNTAVQNDDNIVQNNENIVQTENNAAQTENNGQTETKIGQTKNNNNGGRKINVH